MQANAVRCTVCNMWIRKRCSGVRGNLPLVGDGFRCKRSDGTIQEVDLADDHPVIVGETYGSIKSFFIIWKRVFLLPLETEMDG